MDRLHAYRLRSEMEDSKSIDGKWTRDNKLSVLFSRLMKTLECSLKSGLADSRHSQQADLAFLPMTNRAILLLFQQKPTALISRLWRGYGFRLLKFFLKPPHSAELHLNATCLSSRFITNSLALFRWLRDTPWAATLPLIFIFRLFASNSWLPATFFKFIKNATVVSGWPR